MNWQRPPKRFYVYEIAIRLILAVVAFLVPVNLLTNDVRIYWQRARDISPHHLPYADFLWEYPPLTVLPLLYLPLTGRGSLGFHLLFVPTMIAFEYGSLCLIRRARRESFKEITMYWSAVVVPISMLVWFRFDYMSIFFATVTLVAMERGRPTAWPVFLGFLAKLWPVFFAVTFFAQRRWKTTVLTLAACALGTGAWWAITPEGFHTFLRYRQGQGFQIESIPGSLLFAFTSRRDFYTFGALNISDAGFGWLQSLMNALSILGPAVIAVLACRTKKRNDLALTAGVIAFVLCADRLISAQFVLWMAPFVAYMWPTHKKLGYSYAFLIVLTEIVILTYNPIIRHNRPLLAVLVVRNLWLVVFTGSLLREAFRPHVGTDKSVATK